ncbi:anti-sigma factor [Nocardiopsis kunsanensis]|uniref:Zinc-finger domain-containing protein n=1 Tax=Nocardiopsis kunsanensis TaxID=141693 RepID=A0A918XKY8_9ACTN|nr:hypothetical protein [Nocardiopsis kunsanensis]GHD35387.1 hypothetical protein GCM10007147_41760 [Nocardiopsis kunsanensis]
MTSHPEVEALAFFAEGLLESDEERNVARHVESCEECSEALDELSNVSQVLAAAPAPELPPDVADRLEQQIAEAVRDRAVRRPEPTGAPSEPESAPVADLSEHRKRRFGLPRIMMAAAAAVFVIGGGAAVVNGILLQDDEQTDAAAPLMDGQAEEEPGPDAAQSYAPELVRSGTAYTEDGLAEQAAETLDRSPVGGTAESDPLPAETTVPQGAESCASGVGEEIGLRVVLVDDALYGTGPDPAWVMFAPDGDSVEVMVVEAGCGQGDDVDESVLAQETVEAS